MGKSVEMIDEKNIPGYWLLKDYHLWVMDFIRLRALERQLEEKNQEIVIGFQQRNLEAAGHCSEFMLEAITFHIENVMEKAAVLVIEIEELLKPCFYRIKDGRVAGDLRVEFISFWREIQKDRNYACGPSGTPLMKCPPDEQFAWHVLDIGRAARLNNKSEARERPG